jgi:hypothetical protein
LEVSGIAGAWCEGDFNQQQETYPGCYTDPHHPLQLASLSSQICRRSFFVHELCFSCCCKTLSSNKYINTLIASSVRVSCINECIYLYIYLNCRLFYPISITTQNSSRIVNKISNIQIHSAVICLLHAGRHSSETKNPVITISQTVVHRLYRSAFALD